MRLDRAGLFVSLFTCAALGYPTERPIGAMRIDSVEYIAVQVPGGGVAVSILHDGLHRRWDVYPPQQGNILQGGPFIQAPVNGLMNVFAVGAPFINQLILNANHDSGLSVLATRVALVETEKYVGSLASGALAGGRMGVWGVAPDSQLVGKIWDPIQTEWSITASAGLRTAHSPWITQVTPTTLNLYATALDGTIKQNYYNGFGFSGWLSNPTPMQAISGPTSSLLGNGMHALFSQTRDSTLQALVWDGSRWGGMSQSDFKVLSGPTAQPAWRSEVALYALALDSQIVRIRWSPVNGWLGVDTLGPIPGTAAFVSVHRGYGSLPARSRDGQLFLPSNLMELSGRLEVIDTRGRIVSSCLKRFGEQAVDVVVPDRGVFWYRLGGARGRILALH